MKELISKLNKKNIIIFNTTIIIGIILFSIAIAPITLQNDTFYTIKIGEDILKNGIDMQDHYSWHENLAYTYPHWAYDVFTYLIFSIGGYTGIYITTILFTIILGVTIYLTQSKISKNNLVSALITFGVLFLLKPYIAARAQLVTFILFALTIYYIEMFLRTKKKRYAVGLIIIPIIISNIHLAVFPFYFILYLPYIAEYLIALIRECQLFANLCIKINESKIKRLSRKSGKEEKIGLLKKQNEAINDIKIKSKEKMDEKRKNPYKLVIEKNIATKYLILIMLICVLTGFLTPLGDTPYTYLVKTMQGNTTKSISEHLPLTIINNKPILYVVTGILALLIFSKSKIRLKDLFMVGGLLLLTLMSRRQASMFVLIGAYTINVIISDLFEKYDPKGTEHFIKQAATLFSRIIIILFIVLGSVSIFIPKIKDKYVDVTNYPVEAANFIKENIDLESMKIFNEYNYGSYLLLQGIPVFIDSRADLYAPEFNKMEMEDGSYLERDIFSDYMDTTSLKLYYEEIFEKYGITHVMQKNNSKLNLFLSKDDNYKKIYKDDKFVIYYRVNQGVQ
ncbi:MAG: hypothetical protein Q4G05_00445 [Clostridia bacterium]|nr:hypothetical protein [Clostridia bacterium]